MVPRTCIPFMPTLGVECKILAWEEKHVLVSEEASFPKGHIWNLFSKSAWNLWAVQYGFQESKRSGPPGNARYCWGRQLPYGKRETACLRDLMCIMSQHHGCWSHKCHVENTYHCIPFIWSSITSTLGYEGKVKNRDTVGWILLGRGEKKFSALMELFCVLIGWWSKYMCAHTYWFFRTLPMQSLYLLKEDTF